MKKLFVITLLILALPLIIHPQSNGNLDSLIIQGKELLRSSFNNWTEPELLNSRAYFERLLTSYPDSWLTRYYIGFASSRLVSFYFSQNNKEEAKKYIEDGIKHLKMVIEENDNFAEAHSLLSSLYGNKIGTNPLLGMTLGPKSGIEMGKAMSLEPTNPRNYLIAGWSAFFTPKMFGGGKQKAKKNFEQAVAYFDSFQVTNATLPDWGKEEAYAWLGSANTKLNEFEAAEKNLKKALEINHEYGWVYYVLMPELEKKRSEAKK